jgi:hypothetical protein
MKRLLSNILFVSLLFLSVSPSAIAESQIVDVPGFATLEYPKQVKLLTKECQNVTIKYEINEGLDLDGAALLVQVGSIKRKEQVGYTAWFGNIPGSTATLPMPMIGGMKLKVCKKDWKLKDQKFIGVKPRSYDVYIAYGIYQIDGSVQKEVITNKIKFTK